MGQTKSGRPRSREAQEAILEAAYALLLESDGRSVTIEAIAKRAGVGKPTIYRWWPTLADIVLEALHSKAEVEIEGVPHEAGPETVHGFLRKSIKAIQAGSGVHLRFLMAQAQQDEAFCQRFREQFVSKRRAVLRSVLKNEAGKGAGWGLDLAVDMVFGAMWYRLLTGHAALDEAFVDELAEAAVNLL